MHSDERCAEYQAATANPAAYLEQHFSLRKTDEIKKIEELFRNFAASTGALCEQVEEAVHAFQSGTTLPEFVLQAASGIVAKRSRHN